MDHDERDRRDRSDEPDPGPAEPGDPTPADASTEPTQPTEAGAPRPPEPAEPESEAPSEIEAWPSQDARTDEPAWPTEPPAAGSASADTWPTTPPERGAEPILEPPPRQAEPPPSEVEAHPAAADATPPDAAAAAHSVPAAESATGESTQCPRCGTENRPGLAFCRNCGQRLVAAGVASTVERPSAPEGTQACPRCGTHNRAGVAFCQNCGANLRGTAAGYVPPAVVGEEAVAEESARRGAVLGPVVLLIGLVGLITAYLLPFEYGAGSLFERAAGAGGYGLAFWNGYPGGDATLADQAYFGLAAPVPLLGVLLIALAVAGLVRAAPGLLQAIGLGVTLLWSAGLAILFVVVELAGTWGGDIVALLRDLSPAGIIFFLAALIVIIGALTRVGRS